jgi:hypothetical protein
LDRVGLLFEPTTLAHSTVVYMILSSKYLQDLDQLLSCLFLEYLMNK